MFVLQSAETFANIKFWQSMTMAAGFLCHDILKTDYKLYINLGTCVIGCLLLFSSKNVRIESKSKLNA